jgi:signal transduction histidine kinase
LVTISDNGLGKNSIKKEVSRESISYKNIEKRIALINKLGNFEIELKQSITENGAICYLKIKTF